MKKIVILILTIFTVACNNINQKKQPHSIIKKHNGQIIERYNQHGYKVETYYRPKEIIEYEDGKRRIKWINHFDENDNYAYQEALDQNDKKIGSNSYNCLENGLIINFQANVSYGTFGTTKTIKYNPDFTIKYYSYNNNRHKYHYDQSKKLVKITTDNAYTTLNYDKNLNLKSTKTYFNNKLVLTISHKYKNGLRIKSILEYEDPKSKIIQKFVYKDIKK